MKQVCKYCKERDLGEVQPGLAVDLQQAIETGVVLDTGVLEEHNNIDSPDCVVTRVRDTFHALELKKAYLEAGKINPNSSLSGSFEHGTTSVAASAPQSSGVATASA